ncbi:hypothetical protein OSB04_023665 [Centaurea solstitialis]|uniref:Reverse transcriptase Ty1/copia-type domain-containing protein n=1 Tax=Centaurea solstitialis TaxID=347529 RepID=A0AA38SKB7_9ASTR|nr:hypothetical protein OSB04_023665 [Centaurea solstitialis]
MVITLVGCVIHPTMFIIKLKESLHQHFEMKDMCLLHYFIGFKILRKPDGIYLCQEKYALEILSRTGLVNNKVASTSLAPKFSLTANDGSLLHDPTRYCKLVDTSKVQCSMVNISPPLPSLDFVPSLMLTRMGILLLVVLLPVIVSFLVALRYFGTKKNL